MPHSPECGAGFAECIEGVFLGIRTVPKIPTEALWACPEQSLRSMATGAAGSAMSRRQMPTSHA